ANRPPNGPVVPAVVYPPTITPPSAGSTATPVAASDAPAAMWNTASPPVPNVVSGAPAGVSRATANCPTPAVVEVPATTIRPSESRATAAAASSPPAQSIVTAP